MYSFPRTISEPNSTLVYCDPFCFCFSSQSQGPCTRSHASASPRRRWPQPRPPARSRTSFTALSSSRPPGSPLCLGRGSASRRGKRANGISIGPRLSTVLRRVPYLGSSGGCLSLGCPLCPGQGSASRRGKCAHGIRTVPGSGFGQQEGCVTNDCAEYLVRLLALVPAVRSTCERPSCLSRPRCPRSWLRSRASTRVS